LFSRKGRSSWMRPQLQGSPTSRWRSPALRTLISRLREVPSATVSRVQPGLLSLVLIDP
jgi:hypothetical protein